MPETRYVVEPFGPHHDRTAFSCGEDPLDLYFKRTEIGAAAVIVDAKHDQARRFYEHHEFRRFPENEYRLFLMMKTIGQLL